MADCIKPYYCNTLEVYPTDGDCDTQDEYLSGWDKVGLLLCGAEVTDVSDPVEIAALVTAGSLIFVTGIKGGLDEPSAITIDSTTSCGVTKTINYDRTFTWQDYKVSTAVVQWYNENKAKQFGGALLFGCDGQTTYIDQAIKMTAAVSGENNNGAAKFITAQIAWRDLDDAVPFPTATGY